MSAVLVVGMGVSTVNAAADPATVAGPVTGGTRGHAQTTIDGILDLSGAGYIEEEYFLDGTATAYAKDATAPAWGIDGAWSAVPTTTTAHYKTRLIVRRPTDPARFNGTVVVEWMNVTGQADGTPDFLQMNQELLRDGYAWVGVSAQSLGVNGALGLKNWDPTRYGTLVHPGDSYSYDIFSQAGQALRGGPGVNPLGDLAGDVQRIIADGESQSAGRMVTYINAIHPLVHVYDGFLVHSRGAGGAQLSQAPLPVVNAPSVAHIRTDLQQPVFTIENETDIAFGFFAARQPDTDTIRTWELAGTAHFDQYGLDFVATTGARDFPGIVLVPACVFPANTAHARYIYNAALFHLNNWIELGLAPPTGTPITLNPNLSIARDVYGNALGGVRLPELDVPIATQQGVGNNSVTPPNFCVLFGVSAPFSAATLATLYPNHGKYVSKYSKAVDAIVGRYILPYNADEALAEAAHSHIGK